MLFLCLKLPSHWGSIQTTVKGVGKALVQLETTSNHEHRQQLRSPPGDQAFSLGSYNDDITTRGFNHSMIDYKICPRSVIVFCISPLISH